MGKILKIIAGLFLTVPLRTLIIIGALVLGIGIIGSIAAGRDEPGMPRGFEIMQVEGTDGTGAQYDLSKAYAGYSLTVGQIVKIMSFKPGNKLSWVTLPNGNGWVLHTQSPSNDPKTNYMSLMDFRFAPTEFDDQVALMGLDVNDQDGSLLIIDFLKKHVGRSRQKQHPLKRK